VASVTCCVARSCRQSKYMITVVKFYFVMFSCRIKSYWHSLFAHDEREIGHFQCKILFGEGADKIL
jgi:hypothetical protein